MRIVYPAYNGDKYNWDRIATVLKPIAKHNDLTVIFFDAEPPKAEWCNFVRVPRYSNITNVQELTKYALKITSELEEFDVLYCWSSGAYFQILSCLLAGLSKKPIVMHVNGDAALSRSHNLSLLEKIMEDVIDDISFNNIDLLIPISSIIENSIKPRLKNPQKMCKPIPFSVDTKHFTPIIYPEKFSIGYAGRVSKEKGSPFFFKLMNETPEQHYRIAGPIQMQVNFPENCCYMGTFNLQDMIYFYGLCSIVALPSYGEGMPANILEAYACGRPILCTPESRPSELPLFGWEIPRDLEAWKKQVYSLNPKKVQRIGAQARDWITKEWPTWNDFGKQMNRTFRSLTK